MKKMILVLSVLALMFVAGQVSAGEYVKGYTKSNGTYVNGYHRSSSNNTQRDNYSTKGNVNPYTGEKGHKTPKW